MSDDGTARSRGDRSTYDPRGFAPPDGRPSTGPLEGRLRKEEPTGQPALTKSAAIRLAGGLGRSIHGSMLTKPDIRRLTRAATAAKSAAHTELALLRATAEAQERRQQLLDTPTAVRPMRPVTSLFFTALLMAASYFTINQILAVADVPPLESYLLPIGFAPVFVIGTKLLVSGWLSASSDDVEGLGRRKRAVFARAVLPTLVLAAIGLVVGVSLKGMAVGAFEPLSDSTSRLSSALMFGGLVLAELAGAAGLAAYQATPKAQEFERAERRDQAAQRRLTGALRRHAKAERLSGKRQAQVQAHQDWRAARGQLGRVKGLLDAYKASPDDSALFDYAEVRAPVYAAPVEELLQAPEAPMPTSRDEDSPRRAASSTRPWEERRPPVEDGQVIDLRTELLRTVRGHLGRPKAERPQPRPEDRGSERPAAGERDTGA
ncbi:hypothetical protein [Motilibacter deserti]|uniref:Uncharacterized protein n=1 Tax=Motilibacter deserti TaxID=2714956 RepID=A0ABX0GV11_9ACTN|nr:hypothetical protein [Motilibacter deserti]NHC13484.1 hypothetical protein [Motilibacter deserti]